MRDDGFRSPAGWLVDQVHLGGVCGDGEIVQTQDGRAVRGMLPEWEDAGCQRSYADDVARSLSARLERQLDCHTSVTVAEGGGEVVALDAGEQAMTRHITNS